MRAVLAISIASLAAGLMAGCGDDNVPDEDTLDIDMEIGGRVSIEESGFEPAEVRVEPGELVEFTNVSDGEHTVTSDRIVFDSGPLLPDERFTYLADDEPRVAVIDYHCDLHPDRMRGRIVVGTADSEPADG